MISDEKNALRDEMKVVRAEAAARDPDAPEKLAEIFPIKLIDRFGPEISCYWPIKDEMDTRPLMTRLLALGLPMSLPRVGDDGHLTFHRWTPSVELIRGHFGLLEPDPTAEIVRPNLILAPLLAFDENGNRLGYGKGHYDRAIAKFREDGRVFVCGIAYALQFIGQIPTDEFDIPLDWAVTEQGSTPFFLKRVMPAK